MSKKIAVTDSDFPDLEIERELANEYDFNLIRVDADKPEDIVDSVPDASGLIVQYLEIDESVLNKLDNLQVVGRYGIGVDNVDVDTATRQDIWVANVPSYCEEEVSIHTLSLILSCLRKIPHYDRDIKSGMWDWTNRKPIPRISNQTIGVVGFGKIPQQFRNLTREFGFEFIGYDPYRSAEEMEEHDVRKVEFEKLLRQSDIVSIHVPLTNETERLFDIEAFDLMKDHSILINTARGPIIDLDDLLVALEERKIAGVGLDVVPNEPPEQFDPIQHEQVVCTPHVAWYSEESMREMRRTVTKDVIRAIQGDKPHNTVNDLEQ